MHTDIADLRSFYRTTQGEVVRRLLAAEIRRFWGDLSGLEIAAVGYGAPYVRAFLDEAARVTVLVPAAHGVGPWPPGRANLTALVEEHALPIRDQTIDRLLLVHSIELSEELPRLMDEVFRVLRPMGQVLAIAPNRRGTWASSEATPFGTGRPFTRRQLAHLLEESQFTVEGWKHAVFVPPFSGRSFLRTADAWERVGSIFWPGFSGLLVMLATKQIYGLKAKRRPFRLLQAIPELLPSGAGVPAPTPQ
ncbi:MAG: methyltransferase domain-containing protein [Alphaproteobacteria bacterium]